MAEVVNKEEPFELTTSRVFQSQNIYCNTILQQTDDKTKSLVCGCELPCGAEGRGCQHGWVSCVLPPDNGLQLCWLTLKEERRGTLK